MATFQLFFFQWGQVNDLSAPPYILIDWTVFLYVTEVFVYDFLMFLVPTTITEITFVSTSLYFHCEIFKYQKFLGPFLNGISVPLNCSL